MARQLKQCICTAVSAFVLFIAAPLHARTKTPSPDLRQAYLAGVEQQPAATPPAHTTGSLWSPGAPLGQLAVDYKAHALNDSITIVVAMQTSAQSSANLNSQRTFDTSSAITGLAGGVSVANVNPLLAANSATQLKGQGAATAGSQLTTTLSGQVIAVLPNGNLVVEAQRQVYMNNQHETIVVRGVVQPVDITANNTILSSALANLQIEMKGKGIISDSTRPPNPVMRFLLRILGF